VALYVCGVGTMLLRLLLSSFGVLRYQRLARRIPDVACQDVLSRLARQIQLSVVPVIAICSRVAMPVVCGVFYSVILVPPSVASGLTTEQLEAVLLHELIHIRRRDALALWLQRLTEALFFFHPAVWWMSRSISRERELCCDDAVLRAGVSPETYAVSLLRLLELRSDTAATQTAVMVAADGAQPSEVRRRIARVLGVPDPPAAGAFRLTAALFLCVAICPTAAMVFASDESPADETSEPESTGQSFEPTADLATIPDVFGVVHDAARKPVVGAKVFLRPHRMGYTTRETPRDVPILGRQEFEPLPNPFTTMFEGIPGLFIRPAQKRPTNTPLTRMHNLNLTRIQILPTSKSRHNTPPVKESNATRKHK
jgi:beta-lactamase regulating signal transducer with metallopeptidase domain